MAVDADAVIRHASGVSRFVRRLLAADPELLPASSVAAPFHADEMRERLLGTETATDAELMRALRDLRKRVMLRVIARDLSGLASLDEVMTTVTALADIAIDSAVGHLERRFTLDYGAPVARGGGLTQRLHVVAMGKLGGAELNVSSDIDLIFVYPEDGETRGPRALSNHEFFIRLARRLIAILNELTPDGYVFRVDMRLRPLGADGPLAVSFGMLENYFITQGREWERYAWIKARVVCGDRAHELAELVRPFVFRRHFDYSAFESMRGLHREVRREVERRDILDNIKLGPGGIREIEFIVQLFQLVRGGHDTALRQPPTLAVLPLLAAQNLLPAAAVQELTAAYVFLRDLEHRLQYLDDKQTQTLPVSDEDQALIAAMTAYPDFPALRTELERHRANVTRQFESIFTAPEQDAHPLAALWHGGDEATLLSLLRELGYADPPRALARIVALRDSSRVRQMPQASHARMEQLVPLVIATVAGLANPDATLERMLTLLESISRREAYLALLIQYPQTIERGARFASASPWAAEYLAQHPILLDELLDERALKAAPDWQRLEKQLGGRLDALAADDDERRMDTLRHFKHAQTLHLLAQDLAGELPLEKLSDHLSDLADLILRAVLRTTWRGLRTRHGDEPHFAIVAYGKLGGKELGYASDLDIIFLFADAHPAAAENYARLAQRINNWLTTMTPAGVLYETDLRLRPNGASGLLVSSLEGFAEYQRTHAWVWEHQALTRARCVGGDPAIGHSFDLIRAEMLRRERDLPRLRDEIVAMREKMLAAHPNTSGTFDIKHDRGGLIDVEFIVQYLVLGHSHRYAELTGNIGNLALLKLAAELKLIGRDDALAAHDAYRSLRRLQHALRLQGGRYARVEPAALAQECAAVKKLWRDVLG